MLPLNHLDGDRPAGHRQDPVHRDDSVKQTLRLTGHRVRGHRVRRERGLSPLVDRDQQRLHSGPFVDRRRCFANVNGTARLTRLVVVEEGGDGPCGDPGDDRVLHLEPRRYQRRPAV
jgi:hypothetical protein